MVLFVKHVSRQKAVRLATRGSLSAVAWDKNVVFAKIILGL